MMFQEYFNNLIKPVQENADKMVEIYNDNLGELNKIGEQTGKLMEENIVFFNQMQSDTFNMISELTQKNIELFTKYSPKI